MVTQASSRTYSLTDFAYTKRTTNQGQQSKAIGAKVHNEDNVIFLGKERDSDKRYDKEEELRKKVEGLNKFTEVTFTNLSFKLHEKTERYFVQVVEQGTNEVVREIPQEKFLDMVGQMMEFMGLIIDEKI